MICWVRALRIERRVIHQIGLPYDWGVGDRAIVSGDAANDLLGLALDPNVQIQESKAGSCDIRAGRRPRSPALLDLIGQYRLFGNQLLGRLTRDAAWPSPQPRRRHVAFMSRAPINSLVRVIQDAACCRWQR